MRRLQRAGIDKVLIYKLGLVRELPRIEVVSAAVADQARMPPAYTADGEGISPPLAWSAAPSGTGCVAVIVEDSIAGGALSGIYERTVRQSDAAEPALQPAS